MTIDVVLEPKAKDIGGFTVRRALPQLQRRAVGPFVFFDHMGPAMMPPGEGMDVRPHPHIALATITYLFDGEIFHRDSIGSAQAIRPGDVNWMVAGRGIVHSERTPPETRARGQRMHGLQTWVALPDADEETEPRFEHHPAATLPTRDRDGVGLRVIAGTAYGMRAPTGVLSPTLYAHAKLEAGATLEVDDEHEERAVYLIDGRIVIDDVTIEGTRLVILVNGARAAIRAETAASVVLVGGAPLGPRHIWWNFVASSKERIERAKDDWRAGRFPKVPGDEQEFIPLPE
jgi:redox-sensitive bicupin YhaK (pirin superfamily)